MNNDIHNPHTFTTRLWQTINIYNHNTDAGLTGRRWLNRYTCTARSTSRGRDQQFSLIKILLSHLYALIEKYLYFFVDRYKWKEVNLYKGEKNEWIITGESLIVFVLQLDLLLKFLITCTWNKSIFKISHLHFSLENMNVNELNYCVRINE